MRSSNRTVTIDLDQGDPVDTECSIVIRSTRFSNESVKHKQLIDANANFICQGLQPLSVVDEPAFRRLLEIRMAYAQRLHRCDMSKLEVAEHATSRYYMFAYPFLLLQEQGEAYTLQDNSFL